MAFLVSRKPWDCRLPGSGVKTQCLLHTRWMQERGGGACRICWLYLEYRTPSLYVSYYYSISSQLKKVDAEHFVVNFWAAALSSGISSSGQRVDFPLHRKPWLQGGEIWKWFHLTQPHISASRGKVHFKYRIWGVAKSGKGGEKWRIVTQEQQAAHLAPLPLHCTQCDTTLYITRHNTTLCTFV